MPYLLSNINQRIKTDPREFISECDDIFCAQVSTAADKICAHLSDSPIVLLSGPSGSGKTTTAQKIQTELNKRSVGTHTVSMDNYFCTVDPQTAPRTPEGDLDFESPLCLDMDLLNEHFTQLSRGEEILLPHYEFEEQRQTGRKSTPLRLRKDEIVIFEGIHALNDDITSIHPKAFKLYISARSDIIENGDVCFKGTWMRLVRRTVRDNLFRRTPANQTLSMWANIRRGEKLYISPFKYKTNFIIDSSLPYEVSAIKPFATPLFKDIPDGAERFDELRLIMPALELFEDIDESLIAPESLLREFIGGGVYKY